jgi:hypothetical protein
VVQQLAQSVQATLLRGGRLALARESAVVEEGDECCVLFVRNALFCQKPLHEHSSSPCWSWPSQARRSPRPPPVPPSRRYSPSTRRPDCRGRTSTSRTSSTSTPARARSTGAAARRRTTATPGRTRSSARSRRSGSACRSSRPSTGS